MWVRALFLCIQQDLGRCLHVSLVGSRGPRCGTAAVPLLLWGIRRTLARSEIIPDEEKIAILVRVLWNYYRWTPDEAACDRAVGEKTPARKVSELDDMLPRLNMTQRAFLTLIASIILEDESITDSGETSGDREGRLTTSPKAPGIGLWRRILGVFGRSRGP